MTSRIPLPLAMALLAGLIVEASAQTPAQPGEVPPSAPASMTAPDTRGPVDLEIIVFRVGSGPTVAPTVAPAEGSAVAIAPAELGLSAVRRRLGASGAYQPIAHWGWRLTPQSRNQAGVIRLPDGAGLTGEVGLYRQGSLYLQVDVALDGAGDAALRPRIRELQRVRGPGMIYLDHPDFGIIARVRSTTPLGTGAVGAATEAAAGTAAGTAARTGSALEGSAGAGSR